VRLLQESSSCTAKQLEINCKLTAVLLSASSQSAIKAPLKRGFFIAIAELFSDIRLTRSPSHHWNQSNFMKSSIRILLLSFGFVALTQSLSGCAPLNFERPSNLLVEIEDISTGALQTLPSVVVHSGELSILHANRDGRVFLQSGGKRQLIDATARVKNGASYFQLNPAGSGLQALWWSHQDGKNIYFTSRKSENQPFEEVTMVNDNNEVLPPFSIVNGDKTGVIGVAYQDERLPRFQTFFNRSTDAGRTWPRPDVRLDVPVADSRSSFVSETQLVKTNTNWLTFWVDTIPSPEGPYRITARISADEGQTWAPPKTIYIGQRHISSMKVLTRGDSIAVVADELKSGIFALISNDSGKHWRLATMVQGSEEASNSGIEAAMGPDYLHLVWNSDREGQKTRILSATISVASGQWIGPAHRLDFKSTDNTRSEMPTIALTSANVVVAAWIDFRDIRPNIYLAASYDFGKTWTQAKPISSPGSMSLGWPKLISLDENVALAYEKYPTDKNREGRFAVQRIDIGQEATAFTPLVKVTTISEEERKVRLENRVKALWDARIKGDYATAYDHFDFAYKVATPKKSYLENTGVITYLNATLDKITIRGNEADVLTKLRYEMKPFILPSTGKPISVAPVDVDSPGTWVWIGDEWYLVYSPAFDVPMLRY
jgi:hypothetical protein